MTKRFKTEGLPEIDAGLLEVGDNVSFWDERNESQRIGTLEKITENFYHIRCVGKKKRIPINDNRIYVYRDGAMLSVVETPI